MASMSPTQTRIHIAVVQSEQHAPVFADVVDLLGNSLSDLGYAVSCDLSAANGVRNIILGWSNPPNDDFITADDIIYQLEPLADDNPDRLPIDRLRRAGEVWDYNERNVAFLAKQGIAAKYVPISFHPALRRVPRS